MAGSVNKVILIGNLGRDPEVRHTQAGDPIVHLNVATSESWKDREQSVIDEVYYRTFGGWTDKDWDIFERAYFKSID